MVDRFGGEAQRFRDGGELVFDLLARIIDFIVVQRIERAPAFRDADGERPFELIGMELPLEWPFRRGVERRSLLRPDRIRRQAVRTADQQFVIIPAGEEFQENLRELLVLRTLLD